MSGWLPFAKPPKNIKPDGVPTFINNSLSASNLLLVVDGGDGNYHLVNDSTAQSPHFLDPSGLWHPPTLRLRGDPAGPFFDVDPSTRNVSVGAFGKGIVWPALPGVDNAGQLIYVNGTDDLRHAVALSGGRGTTPANGSGYTLGATFVIDGPSSHDNGFIWGRAVNLDATGEGLGLLYLTGDSDYHVNYVWATIATNDDTATGPQRITSTNPLSLNALHTVSVSMLKNSSGTIDVRMFIDGVADSGAIALGSTSYDNGGDTGGSIEDQFQIGTKFHVAGAGPSSRFNGKILQAFVVGRNWSSLDHAAYASDPWHSMTTY